jgi:type IV secretory pathway VirJ component
VIAALALVIAVVAIFAIVQAGGGSGNLTKRQNALDQYTGSVRGLLQSITPAATEENAVPSKLSARQAKSVKTHSVSWLAQLAAGQRAGSLSAPTPTTQSATLLFAESVQLYEQAATIFGLAPDTSQTVQVKMLASAANLRNQATALWQQGVNLLDQSRTQAKMAPSQLRFPTAGAVAPTPPASPAPSSSGGGKNKKKNGNSGGQSPK